MSTTIHDLNPPDDTIEPRTGLVAIDIDPKVVARRMRKKPWKDRASFLDNVLAGTVSMWVFMADLLIGGRDEKDHYNAWVWLSVRANISAILDELGSERPECDDSAAFFAVALNPAHRNAAREYIYSQNKNPITVFGSPENEWAGIRFLYNWTRVKLPGDTWVALNGGMPDDPGVLFREPDPSLIPTPEGAA